MDCRPIFLLLFQHADHALCFLPPSIYTQIKIMQNQEFLMYLCQFKINNMTCLLMNIIEEVIRLDITVHYLKVVKVF
jgi:hypothetical protein